MTDVASGEPVGYGHLRGHAWGTLDLGCWRVPPLYSALSCPGPSSSNRLPFTPPWLPRCAVIAFLCFTRLPFRFSYLHATSSIPRDTAPTHTHTPGNQHASTAVCTHSLHTEF